MKIVNFCLAYPCADESREREETEIDAEVSDYLIRLSIHSTDISRILNSIDVWLR